MDTAWAPYAKDAKRSVQLLHHATSTPLQMVQGTGSGVDLSRFMTNCRQSAQEVSFGLAWHRELYGAAQPKPGEIIEVKLDGKRLWWGVIESLNDYRLQSGTRTLSITARSRDASPYWREVRRVTDLYPVSTPLIAIVVDIATTLGLDAIEMLLPGSSSYTSLSNTQLADLPAWEMLTRLLLPSGAQPFVDAHGRLKTISRDCARPSDIVFDDEQIIAVSGARSAPPVTTVRVKWIDPLLTKVEQQDKELASATITAGFFQSKQEQDVKFSEDGSQRAGNTYLVVKQSANSGLLAVCDEDYAQLTQTGGRITLTTKSWVPTLVFVLMADMLASSALPDLAPPFGGPTLPTGKIVHGLDEIGILLIMASIGTGVYSIMGTPYDFVHGRNVSEAYSTSSQSWLGNEVEIESDFVSYEQEAQAFAVRELIYQSRAASSFGAQVVDDPRIEPGDIVAFPDGTRLYVTGYSRDLTHGAAATLALEGFQV
jgi:hypothetical protein